MGFTQARLETFRDAVVPDLVGDGVKLLFVGINPGLWTAATQSHFARPGNRFFPALLRAGLIERSIDPSAGLAELDRKHLQERGIGITNLVARATARADELTSAELQAGALSLVEKVALWRPAVVAVAGVTAYRLAFGQRRATVGRQAESFAGATLFVVPNPSGLNAHHTVETLAAAYREAGQAAGLFGADPVAPALEK